MKYIFTLITFLFISYLQAQNPALTWAKNLDYPTGTYYESGKMTVDAAGNVYNVGYFYGTVDFDPGPAIFNLTASGIQDIFITKLDAAGNFLWAVRIGNTSRFESAWSVAADALGNVYVTGDFEGIVDFDPGPATFNLTSQGPDLNAFVLKLNSAGAFVWVDGIGGNDFSLGETIALAADGSIYVGGHFYNAIDADPGPGVFNLTGGGVFVCKLTPSGGFIWGKKYGTDNDGTDINHLTIDAAGNTYLTGFFSGTTDFDPGPAVFILTSAGNGGFDDDDRDVYILKLNASGNFVWAKRYGGVFEDNPYFSALDSSANIYTTGLFYGTVDFDPGPGIFNLTSAGSDDLFVTKLDSSGNFIWAKRIGGAGDDGGLSIAIDASQNMYISGAFEDTVDFNPGPGVFNLISKGRFDLFLLKLNPSGEFIWATGTGDTEKEFVWSVALDASGNIYARGIYQDTVDFDPCAGTFNLISTTADRTFLLKLNQNGCNALPVTLSGFTIQNTSCNATLKWTTASEQNSKHFEVQYSTDGRTFSTIGTVPSAGNSNTEKHYSYKSSLANSNNYFRLRMLDTDGSSKLSAVVNVTGNCKSSAAMVYPNPAKNVVTVSGLSGVNDLRLLDHSGKVVRTIKTNDHSVIINLYNLAAGNYILQVMQNNKIIETIKLLKE